MACTFGPQGGITENKSEPKRPSPKPPGKHRVHFRAVKSAYPVVSGKSKRKNQENSEHDWSGVTDLAVRHGGRAD